MKRGRKRETQAGIKKNKSMERRTGIQEEEDEVVFHIHALLGGRKKKRESTAAGARPSRHKRGENDGAETGRLVKRRAAAKDEGNEKETRGEDEAREREEGRRGNLKVAVFNPEPGFRW